MRLGKALNLLVFFVLYCSSCTNKTETDTNRLDMVESMINNSPDSALAILQSIDPVHIRSRKDRADFHLLFSIALDKNGIDLKSDSIIRPALRFYSFKKQSEHKFHSFYYTARIYENNEEYSNAMEYLIKAEYILSSVDDRNLVGLHYASKGRIYYRLMEYKQAAVNFENAAAEYKRAGNENRYFSNMLRCADCLVMNGAVEEACSIISEINPKITEVSQINIKNHYLLKLRITEILEPEKAEEILEEYIEKVNIPASIDWLYANRVYLNRGKVDEALYALQMQKNYGGTNASFHYWNGKALAMKGISMTAAVSSRLPIIASNRTLL